MTHVLTPDQIARYALGAGFGISDGTTATAIAMAESGGDADNHYVTSREDSRGLWQINVKAHPQYTSQNLYDPTTNAKAAFEVYKSSGWKAWTTYGGAKYYASLPGASAGMAVAKTAGGLVDPIDNGVGSIVGGAASAAGTVLDGATAVGGFLQDIENPATWVRVLKVGGGLLLILIGVGMILKPIVQPAVEKGAQVATKAAAAAAL